jgi:hypothetical protein
MPRLFAVNWKYFPMAAICLLLVLVSCSVSDLRAQTLTTTTINDTIYRADGTTALGTVLISWPSFVSAAGEAVAAGNLCGDDWSARRVYRATRSQFGSVSGGHLLRGGLSIR